MNGSDDSDKTDTLELLNTTSSLVNLSIREQKEPFRDSATPNLNEISNTVSSHPGQEILADASPIEIRREERCVLEDFKPCSQSHLWKLMMSFYDRKGPESWSHGIVPHFITCNTFISKSYVKVLQGFIEDCLRPNAPMPLDPNEPLYIIELGAGSGKFSFFMLKALEEIKEILPFPLKKIIFVMTDFTSKNFEFWQNHAALKQYFEDGRLDAAIFDAVEDRSIHLWKSNKILGPDTCVNPIVIMANYLFDTLYHDIFQIDHGELKEGLVSTGSKHSVEPDPLEPDIIQRLDNHYKYISTPTSYYSDEEGDELHLQRILEWYVDYFKEETSGASILLPIGALRALRRLTKFSRGRALVISGDKGNNNPDQFIGLMDPHIAVHGSFSLMVNYHAIGAWFTSHGGFALHNPQEEASLKVSTFVLAPPGSFDTQEVQTVDLYRQGLNDIDERRAKRFPFLRVAFNDFLDSFGPNDFFVLQKSLKEDIANPPMRSIVAMLKLSGWDPDVFYKFRDSILTHAPTCGQKLRNDLCRGIPQLWTNYYILDTDKDIAFEIGRLYYGIREYEKALYFYHESSVTVGEHHVTSHNEGLCHYSLGHLEIALELFQKALNMSPTYEKARSWVEKVQSDLRASQQQQLQLQLQLLQNVPQPPPLQDSDGTLTPLIGIAAEVTTVNTNVNTYTTTRHLE